MTVADPPSETLAGRAGERFAAFQAGNEQALADLVEMLAPILWHTIRAQNLDAVTAEDVLQTTWLSLVRSTQSISDPRAVLQWLIVTAKREAWRVARNDRKAEPTDIEPDMWVTSPDATPEVEVVRESTHQQLWEHIARLPQRCRELLRVIAFSDRPDYAAVATALGMPIGSIGPTRGRCLAKLREQLSSDPTWEA